MDSVGVQGQLVFLGGDILDGFLQWDSSPFFAIIWGMRCIIFQPPKKQI